MRLPLASPVIDPLLKKTLVSGDNHSLFPCNAVGYCVYAIGIIVCSKKVICKTVVNGAMSSACLLCSFRAHHPL